MTAGPCCWAVIPAAGAGRRMRSQIPKQYLMLAGKALIEHSIRPLLQHESIVSVVVALAAGDSRWPDLACASDGRLVTVPGGAERSDSVLAALDHLAAEAHDQDWVLVHDAARPCLTRGDLDALFAQLRDSAVGGLLGAPVRDTMKRSDERGTVRQTVPREGLWHAYTPQMFRFGLLYTALRQARQRGLQVTDEASAVELAGASPLMVRGRADNIKVTSPEDLALAEFFLSGRGR